MCYNESVGNNGGNMKRLILPLALIFLLISCATTGNTAGNAKEQGQKQDKERDFDEGELHIGNGVCPEILQIGFTVSMSESPSATQVKKTSEGSPVVLFLELKDKNWDIKCVHVKAESPNSASESFDINMDYQYAEQFLFAHPLTAGSSGKWTFRARAEDHAGNLSAVKRCSIEILPKQK